MSEFTKWLDEKLHGCVTYVERRNKMSNMFKGFLFNSELLDNYGIVFSEEAIKSLAETKDLPIFWHRGDKTKVLGRVVDMRVNRDLEGETVDVHGVFEFNQDALVGFEDYAIYPTFKASLDNDNNFDRIVEVCMSSIEQNHLSTKIVKMEDDLK